MRLGLVEIGVAAAAALGATWWASLPLNNEGERVAWIGGQRVFGGRRVLATRTWIVLQRRAVRTTFLMDRSVRS